MPRLQFLALVLLSACSGSDDKAEPCALSHRSGAYLIKYTEHTGGDCGSLPDEVAHLDDPLALQPGCTLDRSDVVSSDQCRLDREYTCVGNDGSRAAFKGSTTERDGGATISGVLSVRLLDADGGYLCSGAYDMVGTRQ